MLGFFAVVLVGSNHPPLSRVKAGTYLLYREWKERGKGVTIIAVSADGGREEGPKEDDSKTFWASSYIFRFSLYVHRPSR